MELETRFNLPYKRLFPDSMPRFPNLWFHLPAESVPGAAEAVRFVIDGLAGTCGLIDDFEQSNPEGADDKARVQNLQPYAGFEAPEFNHDHDLHIRYYVSTLARLGLDRVCLRGPPGAFYRLATSIHYEVAQKHRYHPYIHPCPICGVTGEYDMPGDPCEKVHDPLGLELVLFGTVRGKPALTDQGRAFTPVTSWPSCSVEIEVAEPARGDVNSLRLACVVLKPS